MEDFQRLLGEARCGGEDAIARLIAAFEPEIRRTARVLLGPLLRPHLDSVDISQSIQLTLLVAMRNDEIDLSSPEKLIGLTTTMVRRKVADHWRRLQRRQRLLAECLSHGDLVDLLSAATDPHEDPAAIAEKNDRVEHLLDGLSDEQREVLELRLLGHSTAEIARRLEQDPDVLRAELSRLRRRLWQSEMTSDWL